MTVEPLYVTWVVSVAAMVATVVVPLLTTKLPVPALTVSLKLSTKLAPTATPVALSAGLILESSGTVVSVTIVASVEGAPSKLKRVDESSTEL